jgi:hypothetical protein
LVGVFFCFPSAATLVPAPNLSKRIEASDVIFVGTLTRGMTSVSGDRVSNDIVLKADRVLKGHVVAGDEIASHLEGHADFLASSVTTSPIQQRLHGIWFLKGTSVPYAVLSRDGISGCSS